MVVTQLQQQRVIFSLTQMSSGDEGWFSIVRTVQHCVWTVSAAVSQHINSELTGDTEISQVCLQIPLTVTVIYYQLSIDTTLGLQKTSEFD